MPKVLSSSAKLRLEKTTTTLAAAATTTSSSSSTSPLTAPRHVHHHHQQQQQQQQQQQLQQHQQRITSKSSTNISSSGIKKKKKKKKPSSSQQLQQQQQHEQQQQQQHEQQQQEQEQQQRQQQSSPLLSLPRASETTAATPQRQQQHIQVTAELESSPSLHVPSRLPKKLMKKMKKDALEKESRTKITYSTSAAAAAADPPPPPPLLASPPKEDVIAKQHNVIMEHQKKQQQPGVVASNTTTTTNTAVESSSAIAVAAAAAADMTPAKGSTTATTTTAAATTTTASTKTKSLKRKRHTNVAAGSATTTTTTASHPFRIKVKCVVALRMQPEGNHVVQVIQPERSEEQSEQQQQQQPLEFSIFPSPHFVHVWTNPLPGRDEGLALIGKRIRCFFPKNLIQQQQQGNINNNNTAKQKRVLEGEVVSVQASSSYSGSSSGKGKKKKASTTTTTTNTMIHHFPPWKVELLVDKIMLDHFSFLIQTDKQQQEEGEHVNNNNKNNKTHLRNSRLEQVIRGENKVTVKMRLQNANDESSSSSNTNCVKWVIQKRVPTKLFKSLRRNIGDTTITTTSDGGAAVVTIQQDATKLATTTNNGKLGHVGAGCESNPANSATTTTTTTKDQTTRTITDPSSSLHSPLVKPLNGTGAPNKTNGVHNNIPTATAMMTSVASSSTLPAVASPPPGEQPVKKRRKLSLAENNNNNNNSSNAVVIKHVGDGNDSTDQQVANWRWLASRYHDYMLQQQQQAANNTIIGQQPPSKSSLTAAATATAEILSVGLVGEVVKVEATSSLSTTSSSSSVLPLSSLAFVTIRRLVLPELTASGRLSHHGLQDIFNLDNGNAINNHDDDGDDIFSKTDQTERQQQHFFRIPVEELIVISRTIQNEYTGTENQQQQLELYRTHCYSPSQDKYMALEPSKMQSTDEKMEMSDNEDDQATKVCHLCRQLFRGAVAEKSGVVCTNTDCPVKTRGRQGRSSCTFWCNSCVQSYRRPFQSNTATLRGSGGPSLSSCLPCCARVCDCRDCRRWIGSDLHQDLYQSALDASTEIGISSSKNGSGGGFFSLAQSIVESVGTIDFGLPHDFLDLSTLPAPAAKPMTRIKIRKAKQWKKGGTSGKKRSGVEPIQQRRRREPEDYSVFKPTCARVLPYVEMKRLCQEYEDSYEVPTTAINSDRPRNLRQTTKQDDDDEKDGSNNNNSKTMESRAARVKQRRLLKSVAGIQSFEVDTLAGRESQLRFGRSGIHAWGVYADADITAGDMIVEYRGELIENAMAEKREKEYETAKIGSDYMFRIDKDTVCDATKVGNVARFINASCDPNCYTKIITVGAEKRIVIYAKRDISAGQELCYDYKFPLEYNESKRIPCHCGTRNCRGFMNWDKRYVAVPSNPPSPEDERKPTATIEPEHKNFTNKE